MLTETPFILTVAVHKDNAGQWCLSFKNPQGWSRHPLPSPPAWLDDGDRNFGWQLAGREGTESVTPDSPLVLLRYRKSKQVPGGGVTVDMQPTDGLLLWIEEGGLE